MAEVPKEGQKTQEEGITRDKEIHILWTTASKSQKSFEGLLNCVKNNKTIKDNDWEKGQLKWPEDHCCH